MQLCPQLPSPYGSCGFGLRAHASLPPCHSRRTIPADCLIVASHPRAGRALPCVIPRSRQTLRLSPSTESRLLLEAGPSQILRGDSSGSSSGDSSSRSSPDGTRRGRQGRGVSSSSAASSFPGPARPPPLAVYFAVLSLPRRVGRRGAPLVRRPRLLQVMRRPGRGPGLLVARSDLLLIHPEPRCSSLADVVRYRERLRDS